MCSTLCDPIDGSPPGSPVPGILQARTLEWVPISFSNAWKWKVKVKLLGRVWPSATPWTAAHQAPPSMGFSRQEYWSGVPLWFTAYLHILLYMCVMFPNDLRPHVYNHVANFHSLTMNLYVSFSWVMSSMQLLEIVIHQQ